MLISSWENKTDFLKLAHETYRARLKCNIVDFFKNFGSNFARNQADRQLHKKFMAKAQRKFDNEAFVGLFAFCRHTSFA